MPSDGLEFEEKLSVEILLEANTLMYMLVLFEQEYLFTMDWDRD